MRGQQTKLKNVQKYFAGMILFLSSLLKVPTYLLHLLNKNLVHDELHYKCKHKCAIYFQSAMIQGTFYLKMKECS